MKQETKSDRKVRKVTPIGEAKWAHLHQTKQPFSGSKGEPKYQIDIVFDKDDQDWSVWSADVMEKLQSLPNQLDKRTGSAIPKQVPIKREIDKDGQPTGRHCVTFRTGEKYKPGVFDLSGNPVGDEVLVGNGSMIRISYMENVYDAFGGGINFYLNAVQIVDMVEYRPNTAEGYGFTTTPHDDSNDPF